MTAIRHIILGNGERLSLLMNENGTPDFWLTLFIIERVRPTQTQSSINNVINHLKHLRLWETINDRDLSEEFSIGQLLTVVDVHSIRDHCRLDVKSLKHHIKKSSSNVVTFVTASTYSVHPLKTVTANHAANRMRYVTEYLDFLARTVLKKRLIEANISEAVKDMNTLLIKNKPKSSSGTSLGGDPNVKSAPPEAFVKIMSIIQEESPENPYKYSDVKMRNSLMFEVLNATGIRSGELLSLQVNDIDFLEGRLSVVRRHDAKEDPRILQPTVKTRARTVPIDIGLAQRIRKYVMEVRSVIPQARKHPYIFVTHKKGKFYGQPVSNSTFVNRIVNPAISVCPEILSEISRHGFRHYFNYRLSKLIDERNEAAKTNPSIKSINEKQELQIRKELNGWASDSTAETYNLRHIREEANHLMLEDIKYWTKFIKEE